MNMKIKKCEKCVNRRICNPYSYIKEICDEIKDKCDDIDPYPFSEISDDPIKLALEMEESLLKILLKNCKEWI